MQEENLDQVLDKEEDLGYTEGEETTDVSSNGPEVDSEVSKLEQEDTQDQAPLSDPEEERAKANGWKPEGKLTAREFNLQGEWIGKQIKLKKEHNEQLKALRQENLAIKAMIVDLSKDKLLEKRDYYAKVVESDEDADRVRAASKEVQKLDQKIAEVDSKAPQENQPQIYDEDKAFIDRHKDWFVGNSPKQKALRIYAQDEILEIEASHPELDREEQLSLLEQRIEQEFGIKQQKQVPKKTEIIAPAPDRPTRGKSSSAGISIADLNETGMDYYKACVGKGKAFSEKEFLELAKANPDVYLKAK